jgi:phosphate transport system substrate-binding protein
VVLAYNLPGHGAEIKLDGATVADIFLGKVTKWSDGRIAQMNVGTKLPDLAITPVYRSDSSGTSYIFTTYLSEVSAAWKSDVGADKSVKWPLGVGGKGSAGVAAYVKQIPGAIAYVEYSYARSNDLPTALLKNGAGRFVRPEGATFTAAAANARWDAPKGFYLTLTNEPGGKYLADCGREFHPGSGASYRCRQDA